MLPLLLELCLGLSGTLAASSILTIFFLPSFFMLERVRVAPGCIFSDVIIQQHLFLQPFYFHIEKTIIAGFYYEGRSSTMSQVSATASLTFIFKALTDNLTDQKIKSNDSGKWVRCNQAFYVYSLLRGTDDHSLKQTKCTHGAFSLRLWGRLLILCKWTPPLLETRNQ